MGDASIRCAISSAGFKDGNSCSFSIGGRALDHEIGRGFNCVHVSPVTLEVVEAAVFDTHGQAEAGSAFLRFIHNIPNAALILIAVKDECSKRAGRESAEALRMCGASMCSGHGWRSSYALIGIKGAKPGEAYAEEYSDEKKGAVYLAHPVTEMEIRAALQVAADSTAAEENKENPLATPSQCARWLVDQPDALRELLAADTASTFATIDTLINEGHAALAAQLVEQLGSILLAAAESQSKEYVVALVEHAVHASRRLALLDESVGSAACTGLLRESSAGRRMLPAAIGQLLQACAKLDPAACVAQMSASLDADEQVFGRPVEVRSAGWNDGNKCSFSIDGRLLPRTPNKRGFNVLHCSASLEVVRAESFDTHSRDAQAAKFLEMVRAVPSGELVLVACKDECSRMAGKDAAEALRLLGAAEETIGTLCSASGFRASYGLVGIKDASPGGCYAEKLHPSEAGHVHVTHAISSNATLLNQRRSLRETLAAAANADSSELLACLGTGLGLSYVTAVHATNMLRSIGLLNKANDGDVEPKQMPRTLRELCTEANALRLFCSSARMRAELLKLISCALESDLYAADAMQKLVMCLSKSSDQKSLGELLVASLADEEFCSNHVDLVDVLADLESDLTVTTIDGDTALHLAVCRRDAEMCQKLVRRGASVAACNSNGKSPRDLAKGFGDEQLLNVLAGTVELAQDRIFDTLIEQRLAEVRRELQTPTAILTPDGKYCVPTSKLPAAKLIIEICTHRFGIGPNLWLPPAEAAWQERVYARVVPLVQQLIEDQVVQMAKSDEATQAKLRETYDRERQGSLKLYGDNLARARRDVTYGEFRRKAMALKERLEERKAQCRQRVAELPQLAARGAEMMPRFEMFLELLAARTRAEKISAPLKGMWRSFEKLLLRPGPSLDCSCLCDPLRGSLKGDDFNVLTFALEMLTYLDEELGDVDKCGGIDQSLYGIRLLRIKDRFAEPTSGGWADCLLNFTFVSDPHQHVCELQLQHSALLVVRAEGQAHHAYSSFRSAYEILETIGCAPVEVFCDGTGAAMVSRSPSTALETALEPRGAGYGNADVQALLERIRRLEEANLRHETRIETLTNQVTALEQSKQDKASNLDEALVSVERALSASLGCAPSPDPRMLAQLEGVLSRVISDMLATDPLPADPVRDVAARLEAAAREGAVALQ